MKNKMMDQIIVRCLGESPEGYETDTSCFLEIPSDESKQWLIDLRNLWCDVERGEVNCKRMFFTNPAEGVSDK